MSQLILPKEYTEHRREFKKDAPFVFLGITAYSGTIASGLAQTLVNWLARSMKQKTFKFSPVFINHHAPLSSARNILVNKFLSEEYKACTHFALIDDDMTPMEDTLEDLLKHTVDIVSPLIFTIKLDNEGLACPAPLAFKTDLEGELAINCNLDGLIETQSIPGGFFVATRKLIEKISKPVFKYVYSDDGEKRRGTDEYFSDLIKEAGFKMYIDADLIVEQMLSIGAMSFNMAMIKAMKKGRDL